MVNLSYRCLQDMRQIHPEFSVLDLKAHCRGVKYVEETIKMLPETPEPILLAQIYATIASLGQIHTGAPESLAS
jgi:putative transposase